MMTVFDTNLIHKLFAGARNRAGMMMSFRGIYSLGRMRAGSTCTVYPWELSIRLVVMN